MHRRSFTFALALFTLTIGVGAQAKHDHATKLQVATFAIDGMVTKNCPLLLSAAVRRIDGVKQVEASLERKSATVRFASDKTNPKAIIRTIADKTSYSARLIKLRAAR